MSNLHLLGATIVYEEGWRRTFGFYWRALRHEWRRILAWRGRHDPATGRRYGTWAAWNSTIENSPGFDRLWDQDMEPPLDAPSQQETSS